MAAFSVKIFHTSLVSPHSHSLKDVQAALSLTGWMQDIKHRNEMLGKTQCWIIQKYLRYFCALAGDSSSIVTL